VVKILKKTGRGYFHKGLLRNRGFLGGGGGGVLCWWGGGTY